MKKLRVGLILDDGAQCKIVYDFIKDSQSSELYDIELLIVRNTFRSDKKSPASKVKDYLKQRGLKRSVDNVSFKFLCKLESLIVKRSARFKDSYDKYSLDEFAIERFVFKPEASKSSFIFRFSDTDLEEIKKRELDLLVRGGSGILRGKILDLCRFGVISFHYANTDVNRGGPPGFWEVYNREPSTGFIIQRLRNELDGGDVIFKGEIATSFMYSLNLENLYAKANCFLSQTINRISRDGRLPDIHDKKPYAYPLYTTPSIGVQVAYSIKTAWHTSKMISRKLLHKSYRWGVAYQFSDNWRAVDLWKSSIIKNPPNHFLADPFVIKKDGKHVCFVEDYDYASGKGCISAYELSKDGYTELGIALNEDFHLSYPYVFEHEDALYMCPETHEAKDIRIYKCTGFPLNWEREKILIDNVSAADTNIFFKDGKWWLMTNLDSSRLGDDRSELHIFYSDELLSDDWIPHVSNPVIFDSKKARNGGLIEDKSGLFRIFQVQGWDMYGESFGIAKIMVLTEDEYKEEYEFIVPPNFFPKIEGTHTFGFSDGAMVLDFVKKEYYRR